MRTYTWKRILVCKVGRVQFRQRIEMFQAIIHLVLRAVNHKAVVFQMSQVLRLAVPFIFVAMVTGTSLRKRDSSKELPSSVKDLGVIATDEHRSMMMMMIAHLLAGDDDMNIVSESSLWDCLMDGYDKESCKANSNGDCVFCAEPAYGLCVTPGVAEKLSQYPIFDCDLESIGDH